MVMYARSLHQLRFSELMQVYADSVADAASERPDLPHGFAMELAEQDIRQYLKDVFFKTPGAVCAIWESDGRYASALRLEPYRDGLLLAALETHPQFRRQGFARKLICSVQESLPQGTKLYSHVNKGNQPSMKTHEGCGFRAVSDHAVYLNGSVDYRCSTLLYEA